MPDTQRADVDVTIFGGGAAGLWLLDVLQRAGYRVILLEARSLGSGQTIASQGIIHGGLKYTLRGMLTSSARAVRDMPTIWRRCLAGERTPDLSATRTRAEFCHLWQTGSMRSRAAMIGARAGLSVTPAPLEPEARPGALRSCPGVVARLDEQVIDPETFIESLAHPYEDLILKIDAESGLELNARPDGTIELVRLINPETGEPLDLRPRTVVLVAGTGNEGLLALAGHPNGRMQRRPLHMVMARGPLPSLHGHCVDGMHTRATITSVRDFADHTIWQIGGQIAEDGVAMEPEALIRHARREIREILPGISLKGIEWSTYRVDRAEPATRGKLRPGAVGVLQRGNTITGWPTKLAMTPRLAEAVAGLLPPPSGLPAIDPDILSEWPRPDIAAAPWEDDASWISDDSLGPV